MKLVFVAMTLHNFICDSHQEDFDFVYWERIEEYHAHGDNVDDAHGEYGSSNESSDDDNYMDILLMN